MKDIFGSDVTLGGAWVLDGAILSIEGGSDLVAIGCNVQYGRDISEYRPINQNKRYLVAGLGVGSVTITTIIGPSSGVAAFLRRSRIASTSFNPHSPPRSPNSPCKKPSLSSEPQKQTLRLRHSPA